MKKIYMAGLIGASVLFSGCGGSSGSSSVDEVIDNNPVTPTVISDTTTVQVVRGPVLGAIVKDNSGKVASSEGNGYYKFTGSVIYPIVSSGGIIDVDRDGTVSPGDVRNDLNMTTTSGNVLTMVTTYEADSKTKSMIDSVAQTLNIATADLHLKTPLDSTAIEAMSNVLYKYAQDNNVTTESFTQIENEIKTEFESYTDSHDSQKVEQELISTIVSEDKVTELKAEDIESEVKKINDDYAAEYATANNEYEIENGDTEYADNTSTSEHYQGVNCASCHGSVSSISTKSILLRDDDNENENDSENENENDSENENENDSESGESGENQFTSGATIFSKLNASNSDSAKYANNYSLRLVLENTGAIINYSIGRGTGNVNTTFNTGTVNSYTAQVINTQGSVVNSSATNSHDISRLDCNSCHTSSGTNDAPGRIVSFDYSGSLTTVANAVTGTTTPATPVTPPVVTEPTVPVTPVTPPVVTEPTVPATPATPATPTVVVKSFANDVMPIFNNCTGCHSTSSNRTFQVSTTSATYVNIQNIINTTVAENSYLLQKGSDQLSHDGGNAIGSTTNYNTIRDWITEGA